MDKGKGGRVRIVHLLLPICATCDARQEPMAARHTSEHHQWAGGDYLVVGTAPVP